MKRHFENLIHRQGRFTMFGLTIARQIRLHAMLNRMRRRLLSSSQKEKSSFTVAERSDVGRRRTENQDAVAHLHLPNDGLFTVVCDGMGGYSGGEIASNLTIEALTDYFASTPISWKDEPLWHLYHAFQRANDKIWEYKKTHPKQKQMGTTSVAMLCVDQFAYIAHIGDSRLYLLRDDTLIRLTRDHSMIQELIDQGKLQEKDANEHPQSNVILRVLGHFEKLDVEFHPHPIPLQKGDRFLLCSDGLLRMTSDDTLLYYLQHYSDPQLACDELIELANNAGGKDNITVQIIDYNPPPSSSLFYGWLLSFFLAFVLLFIGFQPSQPSQPSQSSQPHRLNSSYQVVHSPQSTPITSPQSPQKTLHINRKIPASNTSLSPTKRALNPLDDPNIIPTPPPMPALTLKIGKLTPTAPTSSSKNKNVKRKKKKLKRRYRRRRRRYRRRRRRYRRRRRRYRR